MGSLSMNPLIRTIAVDPATPRRVYAAGPAGLFRSDDAGLTWTAAGKRLAGEPLAVALDPTVPQTLYAVLTDNTVWQSHDGATSWQALGTGQ